MRNISKHHFSGGIVPQNSIMDTHFSTAERERDRERERREREKREREADQNRMVVDVRKGAIKIFHFAEIVN